MNLFLIFLVAFFPVGLHRVQDNKPTLNFFSVYYSSRGIFSTSFQKSVFWKYGLNVTLGMTTMKIVGVRKSYVFSNISFSYEKTFSSGLTLSFKGFLNYPVSYGNINKREEWNEGSSLRSH